MGADIRIVLHLEHVAYSLTVAGTEKFANYTCAAYVVVSDPHGFWWEPGKGKITHKKEEVKKFHVLKC